MSAQVAWELVQIFIQLVVLVVLVVFVFIGVKLWQHNRIQKRADAEEYRHLTLLTLQELELYGDKRATEELKRRDDVYASLGQG